MMNRDDMGKQTAAAPKAKKTKKMMMGGIAKNTMMPQGMKKGGMAKKKGAKK